LGGSFPYWATTAIRHCPESSSVVLWSSQPSRSMPGPLPSSAGLHCRHSCRLETKAWPSQTIVAQNGGDRPASTESRPGDGKATHAGQSGMAATRGNGNVDNMRLKKENTITAHGHNNVPSRRQSTQHARRPFTRGYMTPKL